MSGMAPIHWYPARAASRAAVARSRSPAAAAAQASSSRANAWPSGARLGRARRPRLRWRRDRREHAAHQARHLGRAQRLHVVAELAGQPAIHPGQRDPGDVGSQVGAAGTWMVPGRGPQRPGKRARLAVAPSASSTASSAQPGRSCPNCSGRPRCRNDSSRARACPVWARWASM